MRSGKKYRFIYGFQLRQTSNAARRFTSGLIYAQWLSDQSIRSSVHQERSKWTSRHPDVGPFACQAIQSRVIKTMNKELSRCALSSLTATLRKYAGLESKKVQQKMIKSYRNHCECSVGNNPLKAGPRLEKVCEFSNSGLAWSRRILECN